MKDNKEEKKLKIEEMNIFQKMSAITSELGIVAKNLNVDMGKGKSYKAVQEKDVLDAVKPMEEKYRIYSYPKERKIVENEILEKENQYGITKSLYLRIETTYEFVNIDKPEEKITMISYADGIDTGDKATGKAMTYSDKYSLLKAYKIATGDDPDKEASPEKGYSKSTEQFIDLYTEFQKLAIETDTDIDKLKEYYNVENTNELNLKQLQEAINHMKGKKK